MKKVLFLLFAVLCLVSCQTATVEDSPELETLVPVVEGISNSGSTGDAIGTVEPEEISLNPVVEPQLDGEKEITENLETVPEDSSKEGFADASAIDEPSSNESNVELPLESSSAEQNDSVLADGQDPSMEDVAVMEEPSVETPSGSVEEAPLVGESSPADEKPIDEPSSTNTPVVEETKAESLPSQPNAPAASIAQPQANVEPKVEEGSFMDRLTSFVLREKLFSFGVLTVFVGIVMLIVVMIRDLVRAGRNFRGYSPVHGGADDEPISTATSETSEKQEEKKANSSIDDDDEFLRSLLNS